jgi:hypothetical protein
MKSFIPGFKYHSINLFNFLLLSSSRGSFNGFLLSAPSRSELILILENLNRIRVVKMHHYPRLAFQKFTSAFHFCFPQHTSFFLGPTTRCLSFAACAALQNAARPHALFSASELFVFERSGCRSV